MDQRPMPTTSSHPTLCRNGCGFFGNPATEGMCSKCHRDSEAGKTERRTSSAAGGSSSRVRPPLSDAMTHNTTTTTSSRPRQNELTATPLSSLPASPTSSATTPTSPIPQTTSRTPKKNRCFTCKKKVGLTGFGCRCGHQFCSLHRYADTHQCPYDYKTSGREELEKHHPKIVAAKIDKL